MQLVRVLIIGIIPSLSFAQKTDTTLTPKEDIEVTFLSSYYEQDGMHSPVTGGSGTEQLSNAAPLVYVHIPLDTVRDLDIKAGVDFYSSASSDNIDNPYLSDNHISGASASDIRQHYSISYSKENKQKQFKNSYMLAASSEYDVTSLSAGYTFEKQSKDKQRDFLVGAKYFFDDWKLIYPAELRNGSQQLLSTDKRHTFSVTLSQAFILDKKMNLAITAEPLIQSGLLSTPFHRVYVQGEDEARVEMLPSSRVKVPVAVRLNAHLTNALILRTFNRVYWDTWDMKGYTFEVEIPIKVKDWLRLYPFYRFHSQVGTKYFAPIDKHLATESFYTSDYDLSTFTSNKYGMGFQVSPLFGVARFKWIRKRTVVFKSIDLRGSYYDRSDGLTAWSVTMGLKFNVKR